jgi:cephalosporin-C deacetylase
MPRALRYRKQPGRRHHPGCWRPHNGLVAVMPDVPFLCHFRRAADICDEPPYTEIIRYLAIHRGVGDSAFTTLSYFDGVSFAERASAPALSSVGLMDQVCPPSTVYAAYHAYGGAKGHRRLPVQ